MNASPVSCVTSNFSAIVFASVGIEPGVEEAIKLNWKQNLTKSGE